MMPSIDFANLGDVMSREILVGTIQTIDPETDTCTVTVNGSVVSALLFYHCRQDSVLRDNGAIQGAAAGFLEDDQVVVIRSKTDAAPVYVVGHVDGVKHCIHEFSAVLALQDGTLVILVFDIRKTSTPYTITPKTPITVAGFTHGQYTLRDVSYSEKDKSYVLFYLVPSTHPPETYDAMVALLDPLATEKDGGLLFSGECKTYEDYLAGLNNTGTFGLVGVETTPKYWIWFHERINPSLGNGPLHILATLDNDLLYDYFGPDKSYYKGDSRLWLLLDPYYDTVNYRRSDGLIRLSDGTILWWKNRYVEARNPRTTRTPNLSWYYTRQSILEYGEKVGNSIEVINTVTDSYTGAVGAGSPTEASSGWVYQWTWDFSLHCYIREFRTVTLFEQITPTTYAPDGYIYSTTYDWYVATIFRYVDSANNVDEVIVESITLDDSPSVTPNEILCVEECGEKLAYVLKKTSAENPPSFQPYCCLRLCPDKNDPKSYSTIKTLYDADITKLHYLKNHKLLIAYQPSKMYVFDMAGNEIYSKSLSEYSSITGAGFTFSEGG